MLAALGAAAFLAVSALYDQGKLDPWLVEVGLNHTHCVRDVYGQAVCGSDVGRMRHAGTSAG